MQRAAYIAHVRPDREEGYREAHQAIWPELIAEANRAGIHNHSVFMSGRTLLVYMEAEDIEKSMAALKSKPVKIRWDKYMKEFLEPEAIPLEEVFHMS